MSLRVVVAPDGFGSTMTAAQAAAAIARGWSSARPGDEVIVKPQSDGGPGFLDCLAGVGARQVATVSGPLGEPVRAAWRAGPDTAYLEVAQACGLHLVADPDPHTAWAASSRGVGELLRAVLADPAVRTVVVGLGGSAGTDGGRGMIEALGGFDAARRAFAGRELVVASDVDNRLTGPLGAAAVFAPQKGADPPTVARLQERLAGYAAELDAVAGRAVSGEPGSGAAGGIGAALLAVGARRVSGADLVAEATGLRTALRGTDIVLTGEGRLDAQTAAGKVVARVAAAADPSSRVVALVGENALDDPASIGLSAVYTLIDHSGGRDRALRDAEQVLESLAALVAAGIDGDGVPLT
ncbi:glycerate kinase [Gordonia sp. X0973]|uniref:glycerate kinase family protein n=1 Tax=Gordonia sp. X0973 TaxID=2742602 RepID=UPI001581BCEB|nr:glycerate kinase [Gordonia sp. X0973]QKT07623.1 glycerate kinase [Gordonia sp. X0973]